MGKTEINLQPSPRLLQVLGDIPLANWQCIAELVDNSLDELHKRTDWTKEAPLRIDIEHEVAQSGESFLVVRDNGGGMDEKGLESSLRAGHSSKGRYGTLGLFGMGFNIATARLGNVSTVETTCRGSSELLSATISFAELQRAETFKVPLSRTPCEPERSGTTVRVQLKRQIAEELQRPASQQAIVKQLGSAYSYLLRDGIPGISRTGHGSRIPAVLTFNGTRVEPVLPCIWSDLRVVTSNAAKVHAVQYVDEKLTVATACLSCGYWDRKNGPETCEECGSPNLQQRERRIWGWLGVQRYIDPAHFGIDFIRYGRKILTLDKSVFTYQDPDTSEVDIEYPIEMPANQGRLVGEIHLDHVPVTYQKNDFDRQTRDWQTAMEKIRGAGPMKPRASKGVNNSPLARLYSAFRRNDPGTRYLVPGDGERAIHSKAKEWAQFFAKGVARYIQDTEWHDYAVQHERKRAGEHEGASGPSLEAEGGLAPGGGAVRTLLGAGEVKPPAPKDKPKELTENERLERARLLSTQRLDLSASYTLGRDLGTWKVTVFTTKERLEETPGRGEVPVRAGAPVGRDLEVFVWEDHPIFREYGRDVRDVALVRAAEVIKGMASSDLSVGTVYGELVQALPDLKVTEAAIIERINATFRRIRERTVAAVAGAPPVFWNLLSSADKSAVEHGAAVKLPSVALEELVEDARFVQFLAPDALRRLIEQRPEEFFDNKVFKPLYQGRGVDVRSRVIGNVVRDIACLNDFQLDQALRQKYDIALALISLDHLESQLVNEDSSR